MKEYRNYTYAEAITAVQNNWHNLEYVNPIINGYREIVLKVVKQNVYAFQYAHEDLKNDRNFILKAVKQQWMGSSICSRKFTS